MEDETKIERTPTPEEKLKEDERDVFLREMRGIIEKQQKDIELLKSVADKKALAAYYSRNRQALPTIVNLREMDGKIVVGWKTIKDEVYKDTATNRWIEIQTVQVLFEDGTAKEVPFTDFNRLYTLIPCARKGVITNDDGQIALRLVRQDSGKEYTVGAQYVN